MEAPRDAWLISMRGVARMVHVFDAETVVGRAHGMSVSRVGLKQRTEGEVEVEVGGAVVGDVVAVVVFAVGRWGVGEEEIRLVLVLLVLLVAGEVCLVGKLEGGVLMVVDGR